MMHHEGLLALLNVLQDYNEFDLHTTVSAYDNSLVLRMTYFTYSMNYRVSLIQLKQAIDPIGIIRSQLDEMRTQLNKKVVGERAEK